MFNIDHSGDGRFRLLLRAVLVSRGTFRCIEKGSLRRPLIEANSEYGNVDSADELASLIAGRGSI